MQEYQRFQTNRKDGCLLRSADCVKTNLSKSLIYNRPQCEDFMPFYSFSPLCTAYGVSVVTELVYLSYFMLMLTLIVSLNVPSPFILLF